MGLDYSYNGICFRLSKDSSFFILQYLHLKKEQIPVWLWDLSLEDKKLFVTEYAFGDGCYSDLEYIRYIAFAKKYETYYMEFYRLLIEVGMAGTIKEKISGYGHPVVNISINNRSNTKTLRYGKTEKYSGIVWCPTTENGTWVSYRNNGYCITGNSDWKQEKQNKQFNEQVTWELDGLDYADIIFLVFTEESKAPITLLELGLHIKDNPLVVCPLEFYRSGNVDIVCDRYKVDLEYKFDDGLKKLIERIKKI